MSSEAQSYTITINRITNEIKKLNTILKDLRSQKKLTEERLYKWMKRNGVKEYEGFKRDKYSPKIKPKRKPKKECMKDSIQMFRNIGIPDPEGFYKEYQQIQYLDEQ